MLDQSDYSIRAVPTFSARPCRGSCRALGLTGKAVHPKAADIESRLQIRDFEPLVKQEKPVENETFESITYGSVCSYCGSKM